MAKETITDSLVKAGKSAGAEVGDTYHDTAVAARRTANGLSAFAEAVTSDTKDGVRQLTNVVEKESSKVISFMRESIQERPSVIIGVAAGLGVLLGLYLSGRR